MSIGPRPGPGPAQPSPAQPSQPTLTPAQPSPAQPSPPAQPIPHPPQPTPPPSAAQRSGSCSWLWFLQSHVCDESTQSCVRFCDNGPCHNAKDRSVVKQTVHGSHVRCVLNTPRLWDPVREKWDPGGPRWDPGGTRWDPGGTR